MTDPEEKVSVQFDPEKGEIKASIIIKPLVLDAPNYDILSNTINIELSSKLFDICLNASKQMIKALEEKSDS